MKRVETVKILSKILQQKQQDLEVLRKTIEGLRIAIQEVESAEDYEDAIPQKGNYREEITSGMRDILALRGRLHRKVILEELRARGIHVGGGIRTVGAYLSVDDQFRNVGRGTWALTESFFGVGISSDKTAREVPAGDGLSSNSEHCGDSVHSVVTVQED